MIKKVYIENFKCIKDLEIELAPFTIFVGPNGSGKTSILEAIALIDESIGAVKYGDQSKCTIKSLLLNSNIVKFERVETAIREKSSNLMLGFGYELRLSKHEIERLTKTLLEVITAIEEEPDGMTVAKSIKNVCELLKHQQQANIKYIYKENIESRDYEAKLYIGDKKILSIFNKDNIIKININGYLSTGKSIVYLSDYKMIPSFNFYGNIKFVETIKNIITKRLGYKVYYISTNRGYTPWFETPHRENWVGKNGEYTLDVFNDLMKPENLEMFAPYEILSREFGIELPWAGYDREENKLSSNYLDPKLKVNLMFPVLGYGSKQLLPIIAQLAYSREGDIILIEEPEISLHPEYQVKLPVLFGKAVQERKQVIITTHSSYLPLSIYKIIEGCEIKGYTRVGEKEYKIKLDPDDIAIYHVTREKKYTEVERLDVDEKGLKGGIPSFIDVERVLLDKMFEER